MFHRKMSLKEVVGSTLVAGVMLGASGVAQAALVTGTAYTPLITSGALPDSPDARIDPNTAASPFSGVVSININYDNQSFICSGALVGKRQVISAGHCVDTSGNGTVVDLNKPGSSVFVVFNTTGGAYSQINRAVAVSMNPDYKGFGHCPVGVDAFCVNDDISVITLGQDAPASAKIYKVATNPVTTGTHITMAGYGTSGDGVNGYTISPNFHTKRVGENYMDLFDGNDEAGWTGKNEVWYADFDGAGKDTFCELGAACTPVLPNDRESGIGGGDSGGPSFVDMYGELTLVANNTFSNSYLYTPGSFGTFFGGVVLGSYADYLQSATGGRISFVPEPGSIALLGMGALMLLGSRRRSKR